MILRVAVKCAICGNLLVEVDRPCAADPPGHPHIRCVAPSCLRTMPLAWAACIRIRSVLDEQGVERPITSIIIERSEAS